MRDPKTMVEWTGKVRLDTQMYYMDCCGGRILYEVFTDKDIEFVRIKCSRCGCRATHYIKEHLRVK